MYTPPTDKTPKSQTPQTARLGRKIRKLRERKKNPLSWKDTCLQEGIRILKQNGDPDTGLAYKIAYEEYEPSGREVRHRCSLKDMCTKCKRVFRIPSQAKKRTKSPALAWWDGLKREDREKVIELSYKNYLNWKKTHSGK